MKLLKIYPVILFLVLVSFFNFTPVKAANDIILNLSADKSRVGVGETITYTLTVQNQSALSFEDVKVATPIPMGLAYINGSATLSGQIVGTKIEWVLPTLGGNALTTLNFQLKAASNIASPQTISELKTLINNADDGDVIDLWGQTLTVNNLVDKITIPSTKQLIIQNGTIKANANASDLPNLVTINNNPEVSFRNVTFDGNTSPYIQYLIYNPLMDAGHLNFEACKFLNLGTYTTVATTAGLKVIDANPEAARILVRDSLFSGFKTQGISGVGNRGVDITQAINLAPRAKCATQFTTVKSNIFENFTLSTSATGNESDAVFVSTPSLLDSLNGCGPSDVAVYIVGNTFTNIPKRAVKLQANNADVSWNKVTKTTANPSGTGGSSALAAFGAQSDNINLHHNKVDATANGSYFVGIEAAGNNITIKNNEIINQPLVVTDQRQGVQIIRLGSSNIDPLTGSFHDILITDNIFQNFAKGVNVYGPDGPALTKIIVDRNHFNCMANAAIYIKSLLGGVDDTSSVKDNYYSSQSSGFNGLFVSGSAISANSGNIDEREDLINGLCSYLNWQT